jgi:hypothetical protein
MGNFYSSTKILNNVYSGETLNVYDYGSAADILNVIYDEDNSALKVNLIGGGSAGATGFTMIDQIDFNMYISGQTSLDLSKYAFYGYIVNTIYAQTNTGSTNIDVRIDDTAITGMDNISFTTTESSFNATALNEVSVGKTLKLYFNSNTAEYLSGSIKISRDITF